MGRGGGVGVGGAASPAGIYTAAGLVEKDTRGGGAGLRAGDTGGVAGLSAGDTAGGGVGLRVVKASTLGGSDDDTEGEETAGERVGGLGALRRSVAGVIKVNLL